MKQIKIYEGRIIGLERMKSSTYGNPRYMVEFETDDAMGIYFCTAVDDSIGYSIPNRKYAENRVRVKVGSHYGRETLNSIEVLS